MLEETLKKLESYTDENFIFEPVAHEYTYYGVKYMPVTTFVGTFHAKFDEDYWSYTKAIERNITQEEMLAKWKTNNNRANEIGTATHNWIENYYNRIYQELPNDAEIIDRINKFNTIYVEKLYKLTPVKFEQRVFSRKYNLAGTMDALFLLKDKLFIFDWKTNKKFTIKNDFNNQLLPPFEQYDECKLNEYSIQTSTYKLILSEVGIEISDMFLCHIGPTEPAKIYKCIDFSEAIEKHLSQTDLSQFYTC